MSRYKLHKPPRRVYVFFSIVMQITSLPDCVKVKVDIPTAELCIRHTVRSIFMQPCTCTLLLLSIIAKGFGTTYAKTFICATFSILFVRSIISDESTRPCFINNVRTEITRNVFGWVLKMPPGNTSTSLGRLHETGVRLGRQEIPGIPSK